MNRNWSFYSLTYSSVRQKVIEKPRKIVPEQEIYSSNSYPELQNSITCFY